VVGKSMQAIMKMNRAAFEQLLFCLKHHLHRHKHDDHFQKHHLSHHEDEQSSF
jgi:hypothetical protein